MSLRRFLVQPGELAGETVSLPPEEAAHARKVLRLAVGDQVELIDGEGGRASARLERLDRQGALCRVLGRQTAVPPVPRLVICPGLAKGPAMELLAVKLTEMAVDQVRPALCRRSVPRPGDSDARVERWRRLAGQALKQCGAARLPSFLPPAPLADVLAAAPDEALKLLLYEQERDTSLAGVLEAHPAAGEVWALVGPEGGFAPEEAAAAARAGFIPCGLPHVILRAETAALAVAAVLRFGRRWG